MIIAIDPGSVRTGVAMFKYNEEKRKADLRLMQILLGGECEDIFNVLKARGSSHIVVLEAFKNAFATGNFRNRRSAQMTAHELATNKLAKKIEGAAIHGGHEFIKQEPSVLSMGRKWCPFPLPKGHIPDDKSAFIHGAHYMMSSGKIDTVNDITMYGQERMA